MNNSFEAVFSELSIIPLDELYNNGIILLTQNRLRSC